MKAACCWNCMLARACWYWNTPGLNMVVAPLAFSSAGLFGKGGKGGSPWRGENTKIKGWEWGEPKQREQWYSRQREERLSLKNKVAHPKKLWETVASKQWTALLLWEKDSVASWQTELYLGNDNNKNVLTDCHWPDDVMANKKVLPIDILQAEELELSVMRTATAAMILVIDLWTINIRRDVVRESGKAGSMKTLQAMLRHVFNNYTCKVGRDRIMQRPCIIRD